MDHQVSIDHSGKMLIGASTEEQDNCRNLDQVSGSNYVLINSLTLKLSKRKYERQSLLLRLLGCPVPLLLSWYVVAQHLFMEEHRPWLGNPSASEASSKAISGTTAVASPMGS